MCEAGEGWALLGSPLIDPQLKAGTLHQPLRIEQLVIGRFVIKRRQDGEVVNLFCTWLSQQANDLTGPSAGYCPDNRRPVLTRLCYTTSSDQGFMFVS